MRGKRMLTGRLRSDSLWMLSAWMTVVMLRPISAGEQSQMPKDKAQNPHGDSGLCSSCHTSPAGGRGALQFDGNVSQLCISCHDGQSAAREAHMTGFKPSPAITQRIHQEFPLEGGVLTCLSCHDVARGCRGEPAETSNRSFLRGSRLSDPLTFCFRCHAREDYRPFNPHDQLAAGKPKTDTCGWCHVRVPDVNGPASQNAPYGLRTEASSLCRNCHAVAQDHPVRSHLQATPSSDMMVYMAAHEMQSKMRLALPQLLKYASTTKRPPRSLPLDEKGRIACYSCHNPHEKGLLPSGNPRSIGAEPKHATNHRVRATQGKVCVVCHQK